MKNQVNSSWGSSLITVSKILYVLRYEIVLDYSSAGSGYAIHQNSLNSLPGVLDSTPTGATHHFNAYER